MNLSSINRIIGIIHLCLFLWIVKSPAQDHNWWSDNVQWDGRAHWSEYIISSPAFMGPNALPVPRMGSGLVDSTNSIGLSSHLHLTKGEKTLNPQLYLRYAIIPKKLSFEVLWIPVEFYQTSHQLKTQRRIFYFFYEDHVAQGDIYVHTNLQLFNSPKFAGSFRLGYKIASSSKQGAARYTDAPGYFFDLTAKKRFDTNHKYHKYSISIMTGLYVWQTNDDIHFQNDAFLYGVQGGMQFRNIIFEPYIKGYAGFFNNGDKPLLGGLFIHYVHGKKKWSIQWEDGWIDFPFQTISFSAQFTFGQLLK